MKKVFKIKIGIRHFLKNPKTTPLAVFSKLFALTKKIFSWKTLRITTLKALKYTSITMLSLAITLSIILILASIIFDEKDINRNLSKLVRDSTGAEISIKETDLNFFHGITFRDLIIYPSKASKQQKDRPLLQVAQVNLHWNFWKLFLLQGELKSASIIQPHIYLEQYSSGTWNYSPILAKLEATESGLTKEEQDQAIQGALDPAKEPLETSLKPTRITDFLPVHPRNLLILPFKIHLDKIGFSDLEIELIQQLEDRVSTTHLNGLNSQITVEWLGNESHLGLKIFSSTKDHLQLIQYEKEPQKPELKKWHTKVYLNQSIDIDNLTDINIDGSLRLQSYKSEQIELEDLPANIDIKLSLSDSLDGLQIKRLNFELLNILGIHTEGDAHLIDRRLDQFQVELDQDIAIDLSQAGRLLKQVKIPIDLSGKINISRLVVNGPMRPSQVDENLNYGTIPRVGLKVKLTDVTCDIPEQQIRLLPVNGQIDLSYDTIPGQPGIKVDIATEIKADGAELQQIIDDKPTKISIKSLNHSLAARISYPDFIIPFVRLGLDVSDINAKIANDPAINTPLNLELFASVAKNQDKVNLNAKVELPDLFDASIDLTCKNRCNRVKLNHTLQLEDFTKLYAFVKPILLKTTPLLYVPKEVEGKLSVSAQLQGHSNDIQETNLDKIFKTTQGKLQLDVNLQKFRTHIPFKNFVLKDLNSAIHLNGGFTNQNLEFTAGFSELGLDLNDQKQDPQRAAIAHLTFETLIQNKINLSKGLAGVLDQISTSVATKLFVGQTTLKGLLPKPINSIAFDASLNQTDLKKFELEQISLKAPDFGAGITVKGHTNLSKQYMPESLDLETHINVEHSGGEGIASGIKTSGKMNLLAHLESNDMKLIKFSGKSTFDQFDLTIPNAVANQPALLVIENVNGDIPLFQEIDISPYFDLNQLANPKDKNPQVKPENSEILEPQIAESDPSNAVPEISAIEQYFNNTQPTASKSANLVSHADFLAVKNFYPENQTLSIKRVQAANLNLEDLEFDMVIKQNWFSLSQFSIGFLGGKIQGDVQIAFSPLPDKFMTSIHLTRLNTTKLLENFPNLKGKAGSWDLFSDPYLDMNVHVDYDIRQNDLGGGIDITRIGKEQLKMMLFYLDPDEKNPSLAYIRTALNFGDINQVSIPIKNGFIGFNVGISVLAIPIPLPKLDRFPITQLISNFQVDKKPAPKEEQEASDAS